MCFGCKNGKYFEIRRKNPLRSKRKRRDLNNGNFRCTVKLRYSQDTDV